MEQRRATVCLGRAAVIPGISPGIAALDHELPRRVVPTGLQARRDRALDEFIKLDQVALAATEPRQQHCGIVIGGSSSLCQG